MHFKYRTLEFIVITAITLSDHRAQAIDVQFVIENNEFADIHLLSASKHTKHISSFQLGIQLE